MKFTLTITLGNDAMRTGEDVAGALRKVAAKLDRMGDREIDEDDDDLDPDAYSGVIKDVNGNTVGNFG